MSNSNINAIFGKITRVLLKHDNLLIQNSRTNENDKYMPILTSNDETHILTELDDLINLEQDSEISNRAIPPSGLAPCNLHDYPVWQKSEGWWFADHTNIDGLQIYMPPPIFSDNYSDAAHVDHEPDYEYYAHSYRFTRIVLDKNKLLTSRIYIKPPVNLELYSSMSQSNTPSNDSRKIRTSQRDLKNAGYDTEWDYILQIDVKIATPVVPGTSDPAKNNSGLEIKPFNYTNGTELWLYTEEHLVDHVNGSVQSKTIHNDVPSRNITTIINNDTLLRQTYHSSGKLNTNELIIISENNINHTVQRCFDNSVEIPSSMYTATKYYYERKLECGDFFSIFTDLRNKFNSSTHFAIPSTNGMNYVYAHFQPTLPKQAFGIHTRSAHPHKSLNEYHIWQKQEGFWFGVHSVESTNNNGPTTWDILSPDPYYNYGNYYSFTTVQLHGAQLIQRIIYIRPPLHLNNITIPVSGVDTNTDHLIISKHSLRKHGFNSKYDVQISTDFKTAQAVLPNRGNVQYIDPYTKTTETLPKINYTHGKIHFSSTKQSLTGSDNNPLGNIAGTYHIHGYPQAISTITTPIGDNHTVISQTVDHNKECAILQNHMTTVFDNKRIHTIQGVGEYSQYANYYQDVRMSKETFFDKLKTIFGDSNTHYSTTKSTSATDTNPMDIDHEMLQKWCLSETT